MNSNNLKQKEKIPKFVWIPMFIFFLILVLGYYYYNIERDAMDESCLSEIGKGYCRQNKESLNDYTYFIWENKRFSCASNPQRIYIFSDEEVERCYLRRGIFR